MKIKAWTIIAVVLLGFIFLTFPATAAVSTGKEKKVIKIYRNRTEKEYQDSIHRVVAGSARYHTNYATMEGSGWKKRRGANFYGNFTGDGFVEYGSWGNIDQADINFMKTVTNLKNGVSRENRYFLDLTSQTVSTAVQIPFIKKERRDWGGFRPKKGLKWNQDKEGLMAIHDKYKYEGSGSSWKELNEQMRKVFGDDGVKLIDTQKKEIITYEQVDPYTTLEIHNNVTMEIYERVQYQLVLSLFDYTPLVLDLNKDGKIDTAFNEWRPHSPKFYAVFAKFFDMTGDGNPNFCEWLSTGPSDGILALPDKNGKITSALQLFGNAGGYLDGYDKLSVVCDKDKNGWIEGKELDNLKLWIDQNNNAVCEADELKDLADYNISKISTSHKDFVSVYETSDGSQYKVWDWWPATYETRRFEK